MILVTAAEKYTKNQLSNIDKESFLIIRDLMRT
jgi:hypothetical protein